MDTNKTFNSPKLPALGKGLASLFPSLAEPQARPLASAPIPIDEATLKEVDDASKEYIPPPVHPDDGNRDRHPGISLANPEEIQVNPFQPRREFDEQAIEDLVQSIRANGIISPLVVRKTPEGLQLIAGERRLRAAKRLGLKQVPIVIRRSTDKESLEIAIIENIQRQDLNCVETALAYFQLIEEFNLTQEEVAKRVGKDRASVANHLRLLKLPEAAIEDLKKGVLTFGHGKALLGLSTQELQLQARAEALEKRLSVRDTEALVEQWKKDYEERAKRQEGGAAPTVEAHSFDPVQNRFRHLSDELSRKFSAKTVVQGSEHRGKIVIQFRTREDLDRILNFLQNST